tara:strand:- start:84 stop:794 length:711 start_codon:yes stop_codon:yes gene_type:complete
MDLKLFGKKISLSLVISLATLAIVLFTCCSCCHSDNVVEAMTGKKKEGFKEKHENIHNTQTKMPGTIVNVAQPAPIQTISPTVPQHTHQQPVQQAPQTSGQLPFNLNIHMKDKKKNGASTTQQASDTTASTSGNETTTTEGFSTLDSNTGSSWMGNALGYATGMNNEDHTQSGISDTYSAQNWTPDHTMSIFSNNVKKASCCATSAYSVNSACPCITTDQFKYLSSRGGNHSNGDI